MEFEYANVSAALFPQRGMGAEISGWCNELGDRPSPQPSPHGRGSPLAAVVRASPLPWGEGQGEGRDLIYVSAQATPGIDSSAYIGVIE